MTKVLVPWVLRTGLILLPAIAILVALVLGSEHAIGVIVGGVLALADSLGIVYLAGGLLEPGSTKSKPALLIIMFAKLAVVGALLWASLSLWGVSGLGLIIGIGAGLTALVIGVSRGSSSAEGKRAMDEQEAQIKAEMDANELEDNGDDSR